MRKEVKMRKYFLSNSRKRTIKAIYSAQKHQGEHFTAKDIGVHGSALFSLEQAGFVERVPVEDVPLMLWTDTQGGHWRVSENGILSYKALFNTSEQNTLN